MSKRKDSRDSVDLFKIRSEVISNVGRNPMLRLFRNSLGQHLSVSRLVGVGEPLSHLGKACHTVAWFILGDRDEVAVSYQF